MAKQTPDAPDSTGQSAPAVYKQDGIRDGIEAIVIAFVLALMFRTFEAEAFVIPTGSMAPGLMGAHHDITCDICGYRYQVNSHELDDKRGLEHAQEMQSLYNELSKAQSVGNRAAAQQIQTRMDNANAAFARASQNMNTVRGTCPICRYTVDFEKSKDPKSATVYSGDRLIVTKFPYEFGQPKRFDVAVFRYPHGPHESYIKRIVGLPDEHIRLFHGDVFTRPVKTSDPFVIARKPERKLLAMAQIVHDNDYVVGVDGKPDPLLAAGWPARWHGGAWNDGAGMLKFDRSQTAWNATDEGRSFTIDREGASAGGDDWLRYQHIVPSSEVWSRFDKEKSLPQGGVEVQPRPELISDFYAYDTNLDKNDVLGQSRELDQNRVIGLGAHWVGDLMLECELKVAEVDAGKSAVTLELVEGSLVNADGTRVPCRFQCRIDLTTGDATLQVIGIPGNDWSRQPRTAKTAIQGPGNYEVRFANFDDQLYLWVDGSRVEFEQPTEYHFASDDPLVRNNRPTEADLAPIGVKVENATVTVEHLRVNRDIYYIATNHQRAMNSGVLNGYVGGNVMTNNPSEASQREFMSNPGLWSAFDNMYQVEFKTGPDDFLPLGDNSPQSSDGRLWRDPDGHVSPTSPYVPRRLLTGEAMFIYWPHSWYFPVPNVKDMEFVK
jgi:signal peptidase I